MMIVTGNIWITFGYGGWGAFDGAHSGQLRFRLSYHEALRACSLYERFTFDKWN
jgi:hypothetical protein